MPRLSVILAVGRDPEPARRAVRAAIAALPSDSRLVILGDPVAVLPVVDDRRVEVHSAGAVSGPQAMNWLLHHTDSELVARADPGDAALPWRFRSALGALARYADVVFAPLIGAGTTRRDLSFSDSTGWPRLHTEALRLHMLLSSRVTSGTLVARRSVLTAIGGYRDTAMAEYDLALRLAMGPVRLHRLSVPAVVTSCRPAPADGMRRRDSDGFVADAFRALSTRLLGRDYLRLPVLAGLPLSADELDEELAAFRSDMLGAARALPLLERYSLTRTLHRRIAATRALHFRQAASIGW